MQLKDVTPIIKAILEERDKIPRIIDHERYIPNPQPYHDGNFMRGGIRKALRIIEQAPVVDAVEVVRCRECIHRGYDACPMCHDEYYYDEDDGADFWTVDNTEDDGFCHMGAKMDGGAENG
jgi:hypothetical protein